MPGGKSRAFSGRKPRPPWASPIRPRAPYVISMPPPNVTGVLHLGHAIMDALEDFLIRYKRMQGIPHTVGARHGSRGHRHPKRGGTAAGEGGILPRGTGA